MSIGNLLTPLQLTKFDDHIVLSACARFVYCYFIANSDWFAIKGRPQSRCSVASYSRSRLGGIVQESPLEP